MEHIHSYFELGHVEYSKSATFVPNPELLDP
jgi:hypothetical protein